MLTTEERKIVADIRKLLDNLDGCDAGGETRALEVPAPTKLSAADSVAITKNKVFDDPLPPHLQHLYIDDER